MRGTPGRASPHGENNMPTASDFPQYTQAPLPPVTAPIPPYPSGLIDPERYMSPMQPTYAYRGPIAGPSGQWEDYRVPRSIPRTAMMGDQLPRPQTAFEAWQQGQPAFSYRPQEDSRPNTAEQAKPEGSDTTGGSRPPSSGLPTVKGKQKETPKVDTDIEEDDEKIDHRKRKRNRTIRSCVPCHNHKRKCDRKRPCGRCTALGLTGTCVYEVDEARDQNDPNVAESERLRRRIAELEQVVRDLRQRQPPRTAPAPPASGPDGDDKRRVIVDRFARFKMNEAEMADNAAAATRSGKRRSSSGKEYMLEPYATNLLPGEEIVSDKTGRKTFLGAPAGKGMLRRLRELMSSKTMDEDLLTVPEELAFTGWFPDMRKTFPFTTIWSHENFSGEIIGLLPNREQADLLFQSWLDEVNSFFLAWHVPSLEAEYKRFFDMSTAEKMHVPLSSLSLYLMICSLGCVMRASKSEIFGHPNRDVARQATKRGVMPVRDPKDLTSSRLQSELYLSAAYQALRLCSFMSNPTINTIQSQILVNVYLLNSERAADAWTQTGALIRQCIAMGLHVDPLSLDPMISMRDAEVRRRVWWSAAGLDALFCVSFGRPSVITFFTTNLPQDRTDDNLSDAPGSAQAILPPSNVLRNETTDMSYHAAYFQLTIPSLELLDRVFHIDWNYSRSAIYGWFSRSPEAIAAMEKEDQTGHTYEDAIRLAQDIKQWYSYIPRGMRFDADTDTAETMTRTRNPQRINQTLALCVKTFMLVLVLHRPYLRADPSAYPESTEICFNAAKTLLRAYRVGSETRASIFWSWWTMSFRAFHAGAVCAFLAIRQPNTELASKCLESLRGAIAIFEDRIASWNTAHPVQADLCNGLMKVETLARLATQQASTSPASPEIKVTTSPERLVTTPLSQIKGFPAMVGSPGNAPAPFEPRPEVPSSHLDTVGLLGDGFNGPETVAFPQIWASMFGIKMDGAAEENESNTLQPTLASTRPI